jgi:hypothetical protein
MTCDYRYSITLLCKKKYILFVYIKMRLSLVFNCNRQQNLKCGKDLESAVQFGNFDSIFRTSFGISDENWDRDT